MGYFVEGVEVEELDETEADGSVVHPIDLDCKKDGTNDDDEEDTAGYTNS